MKRKIIRIDESRCTGCGLCIPNCAEGSLEIRGGKAVLVREALCDGLGACLGHCPEGALTVEEREAEGFDEKLVEKRLREMQGDPGPPPGPICPSSRPIGLAPEVQARPAAANADAPIGSELTHWPVQLALIPPTASFLQGADLLLAADCVPFALPSFHRDFLRGRVLAVACPKLDDADAHYRKLVQIFRQAGVRSATVLRMEVPCCGGLSAIAARALEEAEATFPLREVIIGRDGSVRT